MDWAGAAVAKALAPPPVAAEWCLPLVRPGGAVVLFVGETADVEAVARVAAHVGGGEPEAHGGLLLVPKVARDACLAFRAAPAWPASARWPESGRLAREEPGVRRRRNNVRVASRIYALANQKGGVGKTTTAVNLAACLAEAGERRSSSTSTRRRTRPRASASAPTAIRATTSSTACRCGSSPSRPGSRTSTSCPRSPTSRAPSSSSRAADDGERFLARSLAEVDDGYSFVFLDCPPSLGPLTVNALAAADRVLVPVQAEYYALEGLTQLLRSVELVRAAAQPAASRSQACC